VHAGEGRKEEEICQGKERDGSLLQRAEALTYPGENLLRGEKRKERKGGDREIQTLGRTHPVLSAVCFRKKKSHSTLAQESATSRIRERKGEKEKFLSVLKIVRRKKKENVLRLP